jgi:hypothetical protein
MIGNLSIQVRLIITKTLGCARKWSRDFYETSVSTQSILIDGLIADKGSIKFGYTRNDERTVPNSRV